MNGLDYLIALCLLVPPVEQPRELPSNTRGLDESTSLTFHSTLKQLELPCPERIHINEPGWPTHTYLPGDMYEDCPDAMDFLAKTKEPIDAYLLRLAQGENPLPARYRAVWVLIQRRNAAVVPVLEKMAAASPAKERYLAWHAHREAIYKKQLTAPKNFDLAIGRYGKEEDEEVRSQIADFLAFAKAKPAVPVLVAELQSNPRNTDAAHALGIIGDTAAVPAIIKAARASKQFNHHIYLHALGRLATPEAVDYLIENLDECWAVEALFKSRSPRALPVLQEHLKQLQKKEKPDELHLAMTRVAVLRLSEAQPQEGLLQIAENLKETQRVRFEAIDALCEYDASALSDRILALYKKEADSSIRARCIRLLRDQTMKGITEAMIEHALALKEDRTWYMCDWALLDALNHRLQTSFRKFSDLERHLQKQRPLPQK